MQQHPSYKKPLTLALALAGISSLVYWFEYSKKPQDEARTQLEKKVFALDDPSLRKIALLQADRQVVLECTNPKGQCRQKTNTQWIVQEPLKAKADSSSAQSLLGTLLTMGGSDSISLKDESPETRQSLLKSYRLDAESRRAPTARRIQVTDDNGRVVTAYIGELAETSNSHYVLSEIDGRANENTIFVVEKHQVASLEQPLQHWRDKRIVSLGQNEIMAFELVSKGSPKVVATRVPGSWELGEGSAKLAADLDAMDTFLSGVVFLNAKNFIAEKKDSPEGKKALAGLTLESTVKLHAEKTSQTLRLWSKNFRDGKKTAAVAYATVDELDPVFEVDTSSLDRVKKNFADFRQKKLLPISNRGEIRFVRFTLGGTTTPISLQLEGAEWKRQGEGKPIVSANINGLLDQLSTSVIDRFLPDQPAPKNAVLVEFGTNEKEIRHRLQFWNAGKKILARNPEASAKETYVLVDSLSATVPFQESGLTEPMTRVAPPTLPEGHPEVDSPEDDHHGHAH